MRWDRLLSKSRRSAGCYCPQEVKQEKGQAEKQAEKQAENTFRTRQDPNVEKNVHKLCKTYNPWNRYLKSYLNLRFCPTVNTIYFFAFEMKKRKIKRVILNKKAGIAKLFTEFTVNKIYLRLIFEKAKKVETGKCKFF